MVFWLKRSVDMQLYQGGAHYSCDRVDKIVTIRLSDRELKIIEKYFPNDSMAYAIRSMINQYDKNKK